MNRSLSIFNFDNEAFYKKNHYISSTRLFSGMHAKLQLLHSRGYKIENAVLFIDTDYTFSGEGCCHAGDHHLLTGESRYRYYKKHFTTFFSNMDINKIRILLNLPVSGKIFPNSISDPVTNDFNHTCSQDFLEDYAKTALIFQKKTDTPLSGKTEEEKYHERKISEAEKLILSRIKKILEIHKTDIIVIITPLIDQLKFHPEDMRILQDFFPDNLFDFSGSNYITTNISNFPDTLHFSDHISKHIIDSVLKRKKAAIATQKKLNQRVNHQKSSY